MRLLVSWLPERETESEARAGFRDDNGAERIRTIGKMLCTVLTTDEHASKAQQAFLKVSIDDYLLKAKLMVELP
jgi:hypothetical protein